ncbi:MAG: YggU family protein [Nitrospirae bacterium]|nr:MAG: YggU family protein [Nitrospirota bacterium]
MSQAMIQESPDGVLLTVHVQPGAKRTEYAGLHGEALKFRVAAPPAEGEANDALCAFLAKLFELPKGSVVLRSGLSSRHKRVLLKGLSIRLVREVLPLRA